MYPNTLPPQAPVGMSPEPVIPPPPITPAPAPEIPRKSSTLTTIAVVLLGVAVLALIAYFVGTKYLGSQKPTATPTATVSPVPSATPGPTTNWKTYTNNVLSFKYPSDWSVVIGNSNAITYPKDTVVIKSSPSTFDISLVVKRDKLDPKSALLNFVKNTFGDIQTQIISSDIQTAQGYILQSGPENSQLKITVKVLESSQNMLIATTILQEDKISTLDQILSTFKFLDKN